MQHLTCHRDTNVMYHLAVSVPYVQSISIIKQRQGIDIRSNKCGCLFDSCGSVNGYVIDYLWPAVNAFVPFRPRACRKYAHGVKFALGFQTFCYLKKANSEICTAEYFRRIKGWQSGRERFQFKFQWPRQESVD